MPKLSGLYGMRMSTIFLVALSLSIGWGMRGNFGHEPGAMMAGVLAGIAVALLSGREDWRQRVMYFAFFGGLGWGFGGSISYMYGISFAGSEQFLTCWYGFFATFLIGGLWAGMGGAGTALAAAMDRDRITRFFEPLCIVLGVMVLSKAVLEPQLEQFLANVTAEGMDDGWYRHKSPLYWFDADWFPALAALAGICLFDLLDRRFEKWYVLILAGITGALSGLGVQVLLVKAHMMKAVTWLSVPLGDATAINPQTGETFHPDNFLNNWPQFFSDYPTHIGWLVGLLLGVGIYFRVYGKWRKDSGLILYMAGGWLLAFLVMPVFGSVILQEYGGFRLTPPRSDDWAGITGVFLGMTVYCMRNGLGPVAYAGSLTGILGGVAFALVPFFRSIIRFPGHRLLSEGGTPPGWTHYHSANWHSIMEQGHGFGLGIALAVTMAILAVWFKPEPTDIPRKRWTEIVAVAFVLFFITLMNVGKNPEQWVNSKVMPETMLAPLVKWISLPAYGWFILAWLALSSVGVGLMCMHARRKLDIVPGTWLGRGQLLYIAFLWIMVVANFERALPNFSEGRLVTEWVLFIHAALATFLIVYLPRSPVKLSIRQPKSFGIPLFRVWIIAVPVVFLIMTLCAVATRGMYGEHPVESVHTNHKRWGEEAHWRIKPILKHGEHR